MLNQPFDCDLGIEAARFRKWALCLVHPARLLVGGGQERIDLVTVKTRVNRLAKLGDGPVSMAKTQFCLSRE